MADSADRRAAVKKHFEAYAIDDQWGGLYDPRNPASHSFLARMRKTMTLLGDVDGKRILDLGCGTGALLAALRGHTVEYVGLDISPNMIDQTQTQIQRLGLSGDYRAEVGDVERMRFPRDFFDAVVGLGLLEYLDDPRSVIREAARVTREGGLIVFSAPLKFSVNNVMVRVTAPLRALGRRVSGKSPDIKHTMFSRSEFARLLEAEGCTIAGALSYNKLLLPYPFTRVWPSLSSKVAVWAEDRDVFNVFATGLLIACRT
jgi:ubiquinone/menaquinone biosynthesis C-methylase UbiE